MACKASSTTTQLRLCSDCKSTSYCSEECARVLWRSGGHKNSCSRFARREKGKFDLPSPCPPLIASPLRYRTVKIHNVSRRRFISALALYDLIRHAPGLRERIVLGAISQDTLASAGVSISYLTKPPALDVFSLKNSFKCPPSDPKPDQKMRAGLMRLNG